MGYKPGMEQNKLKDFAVTIDGIKLTNSQIKDITIRWCIDNFRITGSMSILDPSGLVEELPIRGGNTVILSITDYDEIVSKQEFKVMGVTTSRGVTEPIVTLELIDPITYIALGMYNEMSWESETIIGIIDHSETLKQYLKGKSKDFGTPPEPHKNFVIPLHVSFNVIMHWLARNADYMLYQTREDYVIQPLKTLFTRSKKGSDYNYKANNQQYRRNVYDYNLNMGNDFNAITMQPTGKIASFDPNNKHSKHTDESFSSARKKLSETASFGLKEDSQTITGAKYFYKSDYHVKETTSQQWMKHAYKDLTLEILVPGQFGTNIGDIVNVDFSNWLLKMGPEKNINGNWLILEIIDIIKPTEFAQRITLGRSKYFS